MIESKYKLLICDKCKQPQTGYGKKSLKCKFCNTTNKFESETKLRRTWLLSDNNPNVISQLARELKAICFAVSYGANPQLINGFFTKYKRGD